MLHFQEARQLIIQHAREYGTEQMPLTRANGRVLARDVVADRDYPPFHRSAMDGFACRIEDFENHDFLTLSKEIQAGDADTGSLEPGRAAKIFTGAALPEGANAVIRKEDAHFEKHKLFKPEKPLSNFENVARKGEDVQQEASLLQKGNPVSMANMTALATVGSYELEVQQLPKVGIIQTGNEIVSINKTPGTHQIRSSHEWVISAFLNQYNIEPFQIWHVFDQYEDMNDVIQKALESADIILITGGVSAGDYDMVPEVLQNNRVEQVFHKVQIKPGKPLWFGHHPEEKVVFGFPGNPLSTQISCKLFLEPYLRAAFSMKPLEPVYLPLMGERNKKNDLDHFFPANLYNDASGQTNIQEKLNNGSGDITACINTEGFAWHPGNKQTLDNGEKVGFWRW